MFGERARIFPTGGHCGSMDQREFVREMLRLLFARGGPIVSLRALGGPGAGGGARRLCRDAGLPAGHRTAAAPARRRPSRTADIPLRVYDPWEGTNRGVYKFNALFDEYVFLPVVRGYEFVTPDFIENRVTDFFSNLSEFRNATNGLMQARPDVAGRAVIRLALNSTVGVAGLFDVATPLGVSQEPLDFGLTLGRWGVGQRPLSRGARCWGRRTCATSPASWSIR